MEHQKQMTIKTMKLWINYCRCFKIMLEMKQGWTDTQIEIRCPLSQFNWYVFHLTFWSTTNHIGFLPNSGLSYRIMIYITVHEWKHFVKLNTILSGSGRWYDIIVMKGGFKHTVLALSRINAFITFSVHCSVDIYRAVLSILD